jgi:hypothetical protein
MSFIGDSRISLLDVPEASLVKQLPKRPWSAPRVILPSLVSEAKKTQPSYSDYHIAISTAFGHVS